MTPRMWPRPCLAIGLVATVAVVVAPPAPADAATDLATIRQLEAHAQWAVAESLATATLATLQRDPAVDSLALADAWYLSGVAHMRRSGYADGLAQAAGEHALGIRTRRLGPADPGVAQAEMLVGRALQGASRTDSALVHLRHALEIRSARLAPDDTLIAEAWDQIALCHRDRRELPEALAAWDQAITVRTRHDGADSPPVALLRAQTGACWMELGDWARAREVLEGSLATFARIGANDHPSRWVPLNILADLENREGNAARNVDLLQESLRIVQATFGEDSRQALTLHINLAVALQGFGDRAGARDQYAALLPRALAQYGPTSYRTLQLRYGMATMNVLLGDTASAERQFLQIDSVYAAGAAAITPDAMLAVGEYATILWGQGRYRESLAMCDRAMARAAAIRPPSGDNIAHIQFVRVRDWIGLSDRAGVDSASAELDRVATRFKLTSTRLAGEFTYIGALTDEFLGRRDSAWAKALEAERLYRENARANLRRLSDRTGLQYAQPSLTALDLVLALAREDEARTATAWDRLVRARGLVRSELARRAVPRGFERDSAVTGAHDRWRGAQDRFAGLLVSGGGARDSAARAALDRAQREADEAERVYAGVLDARGAGAIPSEHGLADVRQTLQPGQALVAIATPHTGRDTARVVAFVARAGDSSIARIELGRVGELRGLIAPWRAALDAPPEAGASHREREARRLGAVVRTRVWDPISARVRGATRVYLVADGPLVEVPWPALPVESAAYLVERGPEIQGLESERELIEAAAARKSGPLLAVGAPDFDRATQPPPPSTTMVAGLVRSAPSPCLDGRPLVLPALPGSGVEVRTAADAWRAADAGEVTVLERESATETAFKAKAAGCAVIHVATHGVMGGERCGAQAYASRGMGGIEDVAMSAAATSPKHPAAHTPKAPAAPAPISPWLVRRVWLALAGANRAAEDVTDNDEGLLTAEEVATLDLSGTDWVVLSACHSGSGDAWSSEGRLGMRRAFALAGARSVIASAWAIDDAATVEWMRALYAARLGGETDASSAVRRADLAVLASRRAKHRSTAPFYWAAFSASGR